MAAKRPSKIAAFRSRSNKTTGSVPPHLGRYTHHIANHRIISCENSQVVFKYRDYKDNYRAKAMTVSVNEFMRRFLLHIPPHGFTKTRHYEFLSSI